MKAVDNFKPGQYAVCNNRAWGWHKFGQVYKVLSYDQDTLELRFADNMMVGHSLAFKPCFELKNGTIVREFSLQEALQGERLVYRDERRAYGFRKNWFFRKHNGEFLWYTNDDGLTFNDKGQFLPLEESDEDLFILVRREPEESIVKSEEHLKWESFRNFKEKQPCGLYC